MGQHHNTNGAAVTVKKLIRDAIRNGEPIRLRWLDKTRYVAPSTDETLILPATLFADVRAAS